MPGEPAEASCAGRRSVKGIKTSPGDGLCWCHARFGLRAEAANDGICGKCAGRSASSCLRVHTGERLRALDAAEAESGEIAQMLARIDELQGRSGDAG